MAAKKDVEYRVEALEGNRTIPVMVDRAYTPLGAKRKANAMIKELNREGDRDAKVFVSYQSSTGRHGYFNRDGHGIDGKNWRMKAEERRNRKRKKG